ncbi:DNA-binding transcriptional regulator, MarR family [Thermomonospora echinospora]|uniref:DNA-binding transcriptional regulator, MarR family n=1 Tax=Thermomonospora echinospora TaxID=1992 RepID=A0A1H5VMT1_9ACTN|nr:MarR family transcriptional regulator [Thermomonospora echinospora]SEF88609.1 DNA-binding transcriptional regulator, MarR family [Thermomonospora echinospora]
MRTPAERRAEPADPLTVVHTRWAEEGMAGGPWPFLAMCSLSRLHQILARALEDRLKSLELSRTGYFVLTTLALMNGGRALLSTLGRLMMIHPTTVKLTVDQLERAGLVTRQRHPHDRRATVVRITELGAERARAANAALENADEGPLGGLAGRHEELFDALRDLRLATGDTEF